MSPKNSAAEEQQPEEEFTLEDLVQEEVPEETAEEPSQEEEDPAASQEEEDEAPSARWQKRIDTLTYRSAEAERRNTAYQTEIQALQERLKSIEEKSSEKEIENFKEDYQRTRNELELAIEKGDTAKQLELTEKMADMRAAARVQQMREEFVRQQAPRAPQNPPPQAGQAPNLEARKWYSNNQDWFEKPGYEEETRFAHQVDAMLTQQGYDPNSPEYFQVIDAEVKKRFTHLSNSGKMSSKSKPSVAPTSGKNKSSQKKDTLTPEQARIARELGLTTPAAINAYLDELKKVKG